MTRRASCWTDSSMVTGVQSRSISVRSAGGRSGIGRGPWAVAIASKAVESRTSDASVHFACAGVAAQLRSEPGVGGRIGTAMEYGGVGDLHLHGRGFLAGRLTATRVVLEWAWSVPVVLVASEFMGGIMRRGLLRVCAGSLVIALVSVPASASPLTRIGSGDTTCVLAAKADCSDVVAKWQVVYHGNLSGAKFVRARLHGADLRGANLNRADLRGAVLRHAQLQDASLQGANLSPARTPNPVTRAAGRAAPSSGVPCGMSCQGADLSGANLVAANLTGVNMMGANLTGANLTGANLADAVLTSANLTGATILSTQLSHANLSQTNFTGATGLPAPVSGAMWYETTCPNGTVTNTGCW